MSIPITTPGYNLITAADAAAQRTLLQIQGTAFSTPIVVAFKKVTVGTSGSPADIASVTLPTWLTRWRPIVSTGHVCMAESASGTLAGAAFSVYAQAGGAGTAVVSSFLGPSSTSVVTNPNSANTGIVPSTQTTIYLRQTTDSANAGTISVYLLILPCL